MKITPSRVIWAGVWLLLAGGAVLVARNIEWIDIEIPTFARNEAARDHYYAAKSLVRRLGGQVVSGHDLDELPPPTATLMLSSAHWNMFPGRDAALQRWVEGGGRLVLVDMLVFGDPSVPSWTTLRAVHPSASAASAALAASAARGRSGARFTPLAPLGLSFREPCSVVSEPDSVRPMFAHPRSYRVCGDVEGRVRTRGSVVWSLDDEDLDMHMARVAVGKGSVALSVINGSFGNGNLVRGDDALALAALLDLHRGDAVWFVGDESRTPLLEALWARGKAALLLGIAALGLALWRGIPRFGPLAAEPSLARRSIGEQIRRTAAFIAAGPGDALHRAALHALDAAAARTVADYASLQTVDSRAQAIAARTGFDAAALASAMRGPAKRRASASAIAQIERARRALLEAPIGQRPRHAIQPTTP